MQPHAPLIRAKGQGEIMGQMQPSLRPELAAAYSPVPHLLVLGGVSARPRMPRPAGGESNDFKFEIDNFRTLQYEAGLGGYWPLAPDWTLQLIGGVGDARVRRHVTEPAIIWGGFSADFEARYRKTFGQLGFNHQRGREAIGFGYRMTNVVFRQLDMQKTCGDYAFYELPLPNQVRHEFYGFFRQSIGNPSKQSRWQVQGAGTLSMTPRSGSLLNNGIYVACTQKNSVLVSLGLAYLFR
ncbi:hypothetical protein [Hymenobacter convexus]|uniref:hypothetical protein n=1 Tax=Hymenobacter sp. CA1UV-4 TaxID=3063782 RepID=UPI002712BE2A|nr:hypothetical protein [Hymenobacter sp. CA1UV-4]MDO7853515.1 hypothetical protein [Hymenobacter sp. CA1UV-4]